MNETEKENIEIELALQEKIVAFKKKKQDLHKETWRRVGVGMSIGFILLLCSIAVVFGVREIRTILEDGVAQEMAKSCTERKLCDEIHLLQMNFINGESKTQTGAAQVTKDGSVFVLTGTQTPLVFQAKSCPHSWITNMALIVNGLLVLAGLGIATFLGSRLLSERE